MQIPTIIQGLDFTLRIRAKRLGLNRYVKVSFVEVANITANLVRLPSSKTALSSTIDSEGRLIIPISGEGLVCTTYGIELLGFYNNGNWRHQIAPAFEIVQSSTEDNYALGESDNLTIDIEILIGETYASSRALAGTMAEHDAAETSHPYLLQQLATLAQTVADVATAAASGITTHNNSSTAHSDIRESLSGLSTAMQAAQEAITALQTAIQSAGKVDDVQIDGTSILDNKIANIDSSQFGKVDDVKVNGSSVVNNKEANITVPTKVSDLENDSDFVTETEAEQMVEDAATSITIGSTITGEPGTDAAVTNSGTTKAPVLNFTIPQGEQGPQGPQGDSVLVGQGDLPLAHVIGQDNTKAMSQKGITELTTAEEAIPSNEGIPVSTTYNYIIKNSQWKSANDKYTGKLYKVVGGAQYVITESTESSNPSSGDLPNLCFAFLDGKPSSTGLSDQTPNFADGISAETVIGHSGEQHFVTAPIDAEYLYVVEIVNNVSYAPSIGKVVYIKYEVEGLAADMVNKGLTAKPIDLSLHRHINKYILGSGNKWYDTSGYVSVLVPVTPGHEYHIKTQQSRGTNIAFLQSGDTQTKNATPLFAGGKTARTDIARDGTYILTAPSDAAWLYIFVRNSSTNFSPEFFGETISATVLADEISQMGQYLDLCSPVSPLDSDLPWEEGVLNDYAIGSDGNLVVSSYTGLNEVKRYEIEDGKEYYATFRTGSTSANPSVAYYDENEDFIEFDKGAYPVGDGSTARTVAQMPLNIPSGTRYVYVQGTQATYKYVSPSSQESINNIAFPPFLYEGSWSRHKNVTPLTIETHRAKVMAYTTAAGDEEVTYEMVESEWAVMWPSSYTPLGKPTQVIAMLHGSEGFVNGNVMGYNNDGWKEWRRLYISNGYAVVDINGLGINNGASADDTSKHYGCPAAIETLDKAFEFLKAHYNICGKMLIHGTSMGGALAQTYTLTYPSKVLAVALFAPAFLACSVAYNSEKDRLARLNGYVDNADAKADGYANMVGYVPLIQGLAFHNYMETIYDENNEPIGQVPRRVLDIFKVSDIDTIGDFRENYEYIVKFPVPVRCWQGEDDETVTKINSEVLIEAYRKGNSNATLRLCPLMGHNNVVSNRPGGNDSHYNGYLYVKDEAVEWFRQFTV